MRRVLMLEKIVVLSHSFHRPTETGPLRTKMVVVVYNARPKRAKKPPATTGAPYWAKLAAAPVLAAGAAEPLAEEPGVREAWAPEEEAEAVETAPLSSILS